MNVTKLIDLTYSIEEGMLTFHVPWHPIVSITQLGRISLEGRESRQITLGSHTGTHMDAPLHFIPNGKTIDQIPLQKLIGDVTIVDFSHFKKNESVTKAMLEKIKLAKRMIFKFGWGKHWNTKQFYYDWPFFTKEAAEYIVSKGVELIGFDTPSPDDSRIPFGSERDSEIHKIFLKNGLVQVEYVANLDKVTEYDGWNLIVLPLKITGCDGSPVRACIFK